MAAGIDTVLVARVRRNATHLNGVVSVFRVHGNGLLEQRERISGRIDSSGRFNGVIGDISCAGVASQAAMKFICHHAGLRSRLTLAYASEATIKKELGVLTRLVRERF